MLRKREAETPKTRIRISKIIEGNGWVTGLDERGGLPRRCQRVNNRELDVAAPKPGFLKNSTNNRVVENRENEML